MRQPLLQAVLLTCCLTAPAQAQDRTATLAQADSLLRAGNARAVRTLLEPLVARNGRWHEAQYRLARAYVLPPGPDSGKAFQAIRNALLRAPDQPAYLDLRLELEQQGPGLKGIPSAFRDQQLTDTARRLLQADSANARAAAQLGALELDEYLFYHDRAIVRDGNAQAARHRNPAESPYLNAALGQFDGAEDRSRRTRFGRFDLESIEALKGPLGGNPDRAQGALEKAGRYLAQALRHGDTLRQVYAPLARLYLVTEDSAALYALARRMGEALPDDPRADLWRGAALYRMGRIADAEFAFDAGLARLSPAAREAYETLARVLSDEETERLEVGGAMYAEAYWNTADPRRLTPENERRTEHLARIVEADARYTSMTTPGRDTEPGKAYVRWGAPRRTALFWEGPAAPRDLVVQHEDFRLVFRDQTHAGDYHVYTPSAREMREPGSEIDDYVTRLRELKRTLPERSAYAPARREAVPFTTTAFRASGGATDLVVALGVGVRLPEGVIGPAGAARDVAFSVRTDVALFDDTRRVVAERRGSRAALPASGLVRVPEGSLWASGTTLRVPPGPYVLSAEFDALGGSVAGFDRKRLEVRQFAPGRLMLSDLMLAYRVAESADTLAHPGYVVRGGRALLPAPVTTFRSADPVVLYFEVYDLGRAGDGTRYEVETAILPARERSLIAGLFAPERRGGISSRFEAGSTDAIATHAIRLDVSSLRAGAYAMGVRITDRISGGTVEAERAFTLE